MGVAPEPMQKAQPEPPEATAVRPQAQRARHGVQVPASGRRQVRSAWSVFFFGAASPASMDAVGAPPQPEFSSREAINDDTKLTRITNSVSSAHSC